MVPTLNSSITASIHNDFLLALELSRMRIKDYADSRRPLRYGVGDLLISAQRAVRVLLCACWSLHAQTLFAQASGAPLTIVQPREQRPEEQVNPPCQVQRSSEAACFDQFRPRPTPDELRGCHDNDADRPSSASPVFPSRPAVQLTTNQSPANMRAPEQHALPEEHALPERHVDPSIPR